MRSTDSLVKMENGQLESSGFTDRDGASEESEAVITRSRNISCDIKLL